MDKQNDKILLAHHAQKSAILSLSWKGPPLGWG